MALLAHAVRLDEFLQVKQAIDNLVAALAVEKREDIDHRDYCIGELNTNTRSTEEEMHTKATLEMKVKGLESQLASYVGKEEAVQAEVAELISQRNKAQEDRAVEAQNFNATVQEQQQSQALLHQALDFLQKAFSNAHGGVAVALAQGGRGLAIRHRQGPPAPPGFETYEENRGVPSIVALIQHIITKAENLEAEAHAAEAAARDAYTEFVQLTTDAVGAKQDAILTMQAEIAKLEQDKLQAQGELGDSTAQVQALAENAVALHSSCNYIMANFDARQQARDEEVSALREAKAILSGMQAS